MAPGLFLAGCADDTAKTAEKPAEPVTGLHGLYQMYTFARTWAQDLKVIRLTSLDIPEMKPAPGKAAAWRVEFASESLGKARAYTFSVYEESVTVRKGIFAESSTALSGGTPSFELAAAKTDSDQAWPVALEHAKKYAAANPKMAISWILETDPERKIPVWRVIWGTSAATSGFSVVVNAEDNSYVRSLT